MSTRIIGLPSFFTTQQSIHPQQKIVIVHNDQFVVGLSRLSRGVNNHVFFSNYAVVLIQLISIFSLSNKRDKSRKYLPRATVNAIF